MDRTNTKDISQNIILKRNIFWSMLEYELPIPQESQAIYKAITGKPLGIGQRHEIKLILDGKLYDASFRNEGFSRVEFSDHSDIIMLSYGVAVKRKLKEIFSASYNELLELRNNVQEQMMKAGKTGKVSIGNYESPDEYILLSATSNPDVFSIDCVTRTVSDDAKDVILTMEEDVFESTSMINLKDENAGYRYSSALRKIRHLDRSIGESLKQLYQYRCQMTGEEVGLDYGTHIVEAHHIEPFTKSLNNDTSNIIIVSPNYHRIIHQANPVFDRTQLAFVYPNGLVDKVKVNKHL